MRIAAARIVYLCVQLHYLHDECVGNAFGPLQRARTPSARGRVRLNFGLGFPTCREGTAYPVPYVRPGDFPVIAKRAEDLGFYALWGNDHLTTPEVMRKTLDEAPNFYEPLITFASLAHVTSRIRFFLGVIVLPEREVILLAKQLATVDQLTGGRLMVGVGIGSYREEFEAVHPELKGANRGQMTEEAIAALRALFDERRASFHGRYVKFDDVELAPKPAQRPLPILLNAHGDAPLERVGTIGDGWVVAGLAPKRVVEARAIVHAAARRAGRDPESIALHLQVWLSLGADAAAAEARLRSSQHFRRLMALEPSLSAEDHVRRYRENNLLGDPTEVVTQIRALAETTRAAHIGVVFLGNTTSELLADMELFGRQVMPAFA